MLDRLAEGGGRVPRRQPLGLALARGATVPERGVILTADTTTDDIAELLRGLVWESSMSATRLAAAVECSDQTIRNMLRGDGLDGVVRFVRILHALGWEPKILGSKR